ncbi:hypothetical protein ACIQW5_18515 [Methylorubrum thiocyanatum]|uniref:hypothetical protein n=1 Tax=Methylorubrum thiocyanatum TaxID=47958 RepID=UPI00383B0630
MPSMSSDEALRRRLEDVVVGYDGGISRAADALSLPRVFVWRFLKTGRAIPRNAERLRLALDGLGPRPAVDDPRTIRRKKKQRDPVRFSRAEVAKARHLLQYLIAALDAYEADERSLAGESDRAASSY